MKIGPLLLSFAALLAFSGGCGDKKSDFQPLAGGFGFRTKWLGIDSGPGAALYYKGQQSEPALIWPFLGPASGPIQITNDMAFFRASAPNANGELVYPVFIPVQAPGPALDVTDDLLKLWAESQKIDFQKLRDHYTPVEEKAVENGIWVSYVTGQNFPDAKFVVNWEQVSNVIQDVKRTGKPLVIEKPHLVYLKKNYDSTEEVK
jgi:hypothetical protein